MTKKKNEEIIHIIKPRTKKQTPKDNLLRETPVRAKRKQSRFIIRSEDQWPKPPKEESSDDEQGSKQ